MKGCWKYRYLDTARRLFIVFYGRYNENYLAFDFISELDVFEADFEYSINIIEYNMYRKITYIRRSEIPYKESKFINLYQNHFSYVKHLTRTYERLYM